MKQCQILLVIASVLAAKSATEARRHKGDFIPFALVSYELKDEMIVQAVAFHLRCRSKITYGV